MFIAMNVFTCGDEASARALEGMFARRAGLVDKQPGFVRFAFMRGVEDPLKLISMTTWRSRQDFEAWTKSQAFEEGHRRAKDGGKPSPHGPLRIENVLETYETTSESGA